MLRNLQSNNRWILHDAAAKVVRFAFPKHLKGRDLAEETLSRARADGGALTTVGRMILATDTREEAEAIREFVSDLVEMRHPEFTKSVIEYTRLENDAEARENMATLDHVANPCRETALSLFGASLAESVVERGRRAALLREYCL